MIVIESQTPQEALGTRITNEIQNHDGDVLCLLAGGSALDIIPYIEIKKPECRTIFMMGDERVSREPKNNNSLQLLAKYPDSVVAKNLILTVPNENETGEIFATRISETFFSELQKLSNLKIIFILGAGTDGHTAGIFPLPKERFEAIYRDDSTYVSVHIEGLTIDSRASFTPNWILTKADQVFGYIVGQAKESILNELKTEAKEVHERPAEILKLHSNGTIYTDIYGKAH